MPLRTWQSGQDSTYYLRIIAKLEVGSYLAKAVAEGVLTRVLQASQASLRDTCHSLEVGLPVVAHVLESCSIQPPAAQSQLKDTRHEHHYAGTELQQLRAAQRTHAHEMDALKDCLHQSQRLTAQW